MAARIASMLSAIKPRRFGKFGKFGKADQSGRHIKLGRLDKLGRLGQRRYWTREITFITLSIITVIVLCVVLQANDHQPLWRGNVTLNAIVSIFVTLLYALLSTLIKSSLLQLKWIHFRSFNSLADLQVYDGASRGADSLNALRLIFSRRNGLLSPIAALLGILIFSIGPLSQQILQFDTRVFATAGNASIPIAIKSPELTILDLYSTFNVGLFGAMESNFTVVPTCLSSTGGGNCSWSDYATLMFQAGCQEMPQSFEFADSNAVSLALDSNNQSSSLGLDAVWRGNTSYLSLARLADVSRWALLENCNQARDARSNIPQYYDVEFALVDIVAPQDYKTSCLSGKDKLASQDIMISYVMGRTTGRQYLTNIDDHASPVYSTSGSNVTYDRIKTWSCSIDLILQPMRASFANNTLVESPLQPPIWHDATLPGIPNNGRGDCNLTYHSNLSYEWAGKSIPVSVPLLQGAYTTLRGLLTGNGTQTAAAACVNKTAGYNTTGLSVGLFTQVVSGDPSSNPVSYATDPAQLLSGVARSMTQMARKIDSTLVSGTVWAEETVFRVSWPWLAIPLVLVVATAALTAATAYATQRRGLPTWTDSSLAAIVHGMDERTRSSLLGMHDAERLEEACKEIQVRLEGSDFVLRQQLKATESQSSEGQF